ncbi:Gpi-anchored protein lorelei [Thalictrum thalictroides]|uniref:Gpi-anchored protein lorelei n=1 Tax=Thalictrum thalictroides TaxID=46969 RepID=A0A7J6V714_THATH|nr:Gpi-anchored protein lorelei [Thalictrum thalictroides]
MALLNHHFFVFFFLFALAAASSSSDSSNYYGSTGRTLLQTKAPCKVNFEFANYTVITSQCKGPKYPAEQCCDAFKKFACPYADAINDEKTECATTMFSYINLYGKYPPGLFSSECKEDKQGLNCEKYLNDTSSDAKSAGYVVQRPYLLAAGSLVLLAHILV